MIKYFPNNKQRFPIKNKMASCDENAPSGNDAGASSSSREYLVAW